MPRAKRMSWWAKTIITFAIGTIISGVGWYFVWITRCVVEHEASYKDMDRRVTKVEDQVPILHRRITEATK